MGGAWERQALIKARPCAGDLSLGRAFLRRVRPFVFPRYFDDATLEDIRNTKQQTESHIARKGQAELEVKLGARGDSGHRIHGANAAIAERRTLARLAHDEHA